MLRNARWLPAVLSTQARIWALAISSSGLAIHAAEVNSGVIWSRQFGTNRDDAVRAVIASPSGAVYVAGDTKGNLAAAISGNHDAFIRQYTAAGTAVWTSQVGTAGSDGISSLAIDSSENVYGVGETFTTVASQDAVVLRKYSSSGTMLWTRTIGTTEPEYDANVAIDSDNNVFLSGRTFGSLGGPNQGDSDIFLVKYDSEGTLQWSRQFGGPAREFGAAVDVDLFGNAYVVSSLQRVSLNDFQIVLLKYDPTGNLVWTRELGEEDSDQGGRVAVDASGNVYIGGVTHDSIGGPALGQKDAVIAKYDTDGNLQWTRQVGTSFTDSIAGLAVAPAGGVYVSASTFGGLPNAGVNILLQRFNRDGVPLGTRFFGMHFDDMPGGLDVDDDGYVYLSGSSYGPLAGPTVGLVDAFLLKLAPIPEPSPLIMCALSWIGVIATPRRDSR